MQQGQSQQAAFQARMQAEHAQRAHAYGQSPAMHPASGAPSAVATPMQYHPSPGSHFSYGMGHGAGGSPWGPGRHVTPMFYPNSHSSMASPMPLPPFFGAQESGQQSHPSHLSNAHYDMQNAQQHAHRQQHNSFGQGPGRAYPHQTASSGPPGSRGSTPHGGYSVSGMSPHSAYAHPHAWHQQHPQRQYLSSSNTPRFSLPHGAIPNGNNPPTTSPYGAYPPRPQGRDYVGPHEREYFQARERSLNSQISSSQASPSGGQFKRYPRNDIDPRRYPMQMAQLEHAMRRWQDSAPGRKLQKTFNMERMQLPRNANDDRCVRRSNSFGGRLSIPVMTENDIPVAHDDRHLMDPIDVESELRRRQHDHELVHTNPERPHHNPHRNQEYFWNDTSTSRDSKSRGKESMTRSRQRHQMLRALELDGPEPRCESDMVTRWTYETPWPCFNVGYSYRVDRGGVLAVGSFIAENMRGNRRTHRRRLRAQTF
jgi:hypothetical protein